MRVNVTEQGLIIPKEFLTGIQAVDIRRDHDQIILTPSAETEPSQRDEKGWPIGFFETVIGGWVGEPLERPKQIIF
jgi:hypothetical protein